MHVLRNFRVFKALVCPVYRPLQQRAVGLLLGAPRAGDIDRLLHAAPAAGAQQQLRHSVTAVSSKCEQCHVYSRRTSVNTHLSCRQLQQDTPYMAKKKRKTTNVLWTWIL